MPLKRTTFGLLNCKKKKKKIPFADWTLYMGWLWDSGPLGRYAKGPHHLSYIGSRHTEFLVVLHLFVVVCVSLRLYCVFFWLFHVSLWLFSVSLQLLCISLWSLWVSPWSVHVNLSDILQVRARHFDTLGLWASASMTAQSPEEHVAIYISANHRHITFVRFMQIISVLPKSCSSDSSCMSLVSPADHHSGPTNNKSDCF